MGAAGLEGDGVGGGLCPLRGDGVRRSVTAPVMGKGSGASPVREASGVPCRRVWRGRSVMSPEGVLSVVSGVPGRGAFMGVSSVPQSGTGSAVLALAGLGIVSVTQGRAGVRRVA